MSTISKIIERPSDAPREPVYPRLLKYIEGPSEFIVWAYGPGDGKSTFEGIVVAVGSDLASERPVGYRTDSWWKSSFVVFDGAVTLYNK